MFLSLSSGSSGNAAIIKHKTTTLLIDCGISGKRLIEILSGADIDPNTINAMLITHEHSDHISGAGVVSRKYDIPVYATEKTHEAMNIGRISEKNIKIIKANSGFSIGDIGIRSFSIPHDAADPVGYAFSTGKKKYAVATDMGEMTEEVFRAISGSDRIMLEANHDVDMLMYGDYPYQLKKRILGKRGHLSNDSAAENALKLVEGNTTQIMLSHLSDKNNDPDVAYKTVEIFLKNNGVEPGRDIRLSVAARYGVTRFI